MDERNDRSGRLPLYEQALASRRAARANRETARATRERIELSALFPRDRLAGLKEARSVFMALPVPAAILGPDGRVTDVNNEWRAAMASRSDLVDVGAQYGSSWPRPEGGGVVREGVQALLAGDIDRFECEQTIPTDEASRIIIIQMRALADGRQRLALVVHLDASRQREHDEQLLHQATHDPLTEVANRALLYHRLTEVIERAHRFNEQYALLYLDLDGFKEVNDTSGHVVGDALLHAVAQSWQLEMRATDLLARVGGDEFVVLMERVGGLDDAAKLADRLRAAIARPILIEEDPICVSASIGIAMPAEARTAEDAIAEADAQMYRSKRSRMPRARRPSP